MRKLFEICPKIQFFKLSGCFLRFKLSEFGQKRCKIECFDVSGTTWKSPCLIKPWENDNFPKFSSIFSLSLPTIWHSHLLQNYFFETYENRAIVTKSVILTLGNLWFLEVFENYLFFLIILTIISEKRHVIKQLPW